jgi:hypothetical protein
VAARRLWPCGMTGTSWSEATVRGRWRGGKRMLAGRREGCGGCAEQKVATYHQVPLRLLLLEACVHNSYTLSQRYDREALHRRMAPGLRNILSAKERL